MKWSMDTHKFMSEITRTALQVLSEYNVTSDSLDEEIIAAERELANRGVYKDYASAQGRIRRALFTYFKAYGCMNENEQLTEIGHLFVENRISVQELCFHYVLNYFYKDETTEYFPTELILNFLSGLKAIDEEQAYLTPYDFSRITECNSVADIDNDFIAGQLKSRTEQQITVNERSIGYDVWSNVLINSGILKKTDSQKLMIKNEELADWIMSAYKQPQHIQKGKVVSGVIEYIPIISLSTHGGNAEIFAKEGKALQAYLFTETIDEEVIKKYIYQQQTVPFSNMVTTLGITNARGFYLNFDGYEHLVGVVLSQKEEQNLKIIGSILASLPIYNWEEDVNQGDASVNRNIIYFGAPGTGKSHTLEAERQDLLGRDNETDYERVTFHADYSYAHFVGTYKPIMVDNGGEELDDDHKAVLSVLTDDKKTAQEKYDELYEKFRDEKELTRLPILIGLFTDEEFKTKKADGTDTADDNGGERDHGKKLRQYVHFITEYKSSSDISYEYVPGPFMRVFVNAKKNPTKPYLLIIEEINRANVAAVFGDVFQLLDRDENGESKYPIQTSEDMRKYLAKELNVNPSEVSKIKIPRNMYIWATMNSADQGVFPMDTAFKRRWDFTYIGIDDSEDGIKGKEFKVGQTEKQSVEWNDLRKAINEYLSKLGINEDKQLGPYFLSKEIINSGDDERFNKAFTNKVLMYLFEDAAKQKRSQVFAGSINSNRYSEICLDFKNRGIKIFNEEIIGNSKAIELN